MVYGSSIACHNLQYSRWKKNVWDKTFKWSHFHPVRFWVRFMKVSDALNSGYWAGVPLFPHYIQTHVVLCGVDNWDKCPQFLHQSWNLKPILVWSTSTLGYCISLTDWPKVDCTSMRQSVSNPIKGWCGGCELKADTLGATRGTLALDTWCPLYKRFKGWWKQTKF